MKFLLDNIQYDVIVEKKNNKNLYIRVKDDMKIYVTCNYFTTRAEINRILKDNTSNIQKMVEHMQKKKDYEGRFFYLGKTYDIIIDSSVKGVRLDENNVYTKDMTMLNKWYKEEIIRIFDERYVFTFNHFHEQIKSPILKIRTMKTRYGVYNRKNHTITLNSKLIEFDVDKIDYVIIHELSHIIHFNHSKNFWNLVSKYCHNYKQIRKEMREWKI